jgi:hypothetical protein
MMRNLALTLAMTVVVALAANQVMARGGGGHGGGGHHGGGHHGGGHHNSHHSHHSSHHHSGHHHDAHYAHHNHPFSHGWGHRGWGWGGGWGGGWGNAWAPATLGAAAGWLGAEALGSNAGGYVPVDTVYTSDDGSNDDNQDVAAQAGDTDDQTADANDDAAEENQNVADADAPQAPPISSAAAELAKSGAVDPPKDAKLLPLGVYSIAPQGHTEASAMLQLAITKDGILRGSYYDLLSNEDHQVQGAVDKKTQRVAWTIGPKGKVLFETSLANLTQDKGPLSVHYEDGESRPWTIARYASEEAAKKAGEEAEAAAKEPTTEVKTGELSK